ncbi:MAG: thioesterase family protein [Myxococcota bacterium]
MIPPRSQHLLRRRAGYGDTDQSGIVHHAVYLRWLEDARVDLWRSRGMDFAELERSERVGMAVHSIEMRYHRAARFDDALDVEVWVGDLSRVRIRVDYRVWRDEELLMEAKVTLVCIHLDRMRAIRIPEAVRVCCEGGAE